MTVARVCLVNPPFAAVRAPSLALTQLRSVLRLGRPADGSLSRAVARLDDHGLLFREDTKMLGLVLPAEPVVSDEPRLERRDRQAFRIRTSGSSAPRGASR